MDSNDVADRYFECVRSRDVEGLIALYADDAVITLPNGKQVIGHAAIREFQLNVFATGAPYPTSGPRVASATAIAVEIKAQIADGSIRSTANFFYINAVGRIQRLSVYSQNSV